ncbi:MAG: AbrB/MazE/SpoVT family DNA-binding domain-containing protein [Patescibacteria group bacterium]|nr:AbrB/MazE/SpoVT family DNA-binding domain-containing protein [Patescibacteria group bacterium]
MKKKAADNEFYGATTIGSKGQIVIPCDARKAMKLKEGDKLLVFGVGDSLAFSKLSTFEKFTTQLSKKLENVKEATRRG